MVFALATRRSHENFSAFTHIKYRQFFSDIKRENRNWQKIGSVARKIRKSISSNFFSIESTYKISDLRYLLTESSYQRKLFGLLKLRAIFNFFVLDFGSTIASFNEKNRRTFEKWKKSSFFDEFKTWSKKISISEGSEKIFWAQKTLWGSSTLQNLNLVTKVGT